MQAPLEQPQIFAKLWQTSAVGDNYFFLYETCRFSHGASRFHLFPEDTFSIYPYNLN